MIFMGGLFIDDRKLHPRVYPLSFTQGVKDFLHMFRCLPRFWLRHGCLSRLLPRLLLKAELRNVIVCKIRLLAFAPIGYFTVKTLQKVGFGQLRELLARGCSRQKSPVLIECHDHVRTVGFADDNAAVTGLRNEPQDLLGNACESGHMLKLFFRACYDLLRNIMRYALIMRKFHGVACSPLRHAAESRCIPEELGERYPRMHNLYSHSKIG